MTSLPEFVPDWRAMHDIQKGKVIQWMIDNKVTLTSTFVPFSTVDKSMWIEKDRPSVHWDVHLDVDGRRMLTFRFSSGTACLKCSKGFKGFERTVDELVSLIDRFRRS